jgi:hypothetical protein
MLIALDNEALVSALPDVSAASSLRVIVAHVASHKPLHAAAEHSTAFRLNNKMKVVWHETISKEVNAIFFFRHPNQLNECAVISMIVKDYLAAVSSV